MKKKVKSDILDIIKTLYEAHKSISAFYTFGNVENAVNLLNDCQVAAIEIGGTIEASEGEGTVCVGYLEEYCECLYQVATSVDEKDTKLLDDILCKVEKELQNIKVKLEIVFMPYKASMWDALESVWMAAEKDEICITKVVPIPYYDKNPDGSLGEMYYEGDFFPEYVPITSYEEYDVASEHPDVIYIHNPYDGANKVTSVDPRYYSKILKTCTDCLVYIPYFLVDEDGPIDKLERYACMPAVIHAHYVVVQSERVRQKYIDVILGYIGDNEKNRRYLEGKIIGLGSPKFDAIKLEKPDFRSLPSNWQEILGSYDKKIILYNTHLWMVMPDYFEKSVKKMRDVFSFFSKREDAVLLWRPHPLMIATIKSMNPGAYEEFVELIEEYKNNRYGIYDDTPDMGRAIALSDAYYGDNTSMVPLYKMTGKPILIHDINILID